MGKAEPEFDDLTARARIRDAALVQFAEHGFERTTVRGIAAAAGVSPGLVRHHFGSKQGLRDAVDAHVLRELRRANEEAVANSERGDLGPSVLGRESLRPFRSYLSRALLEGSSTLAAIFDYAVESTEGWFARADEHRPDPVTVDPRTRAAVLTAMVFGIPLLHDQLVRVLGMDIFSDEGDLLLAQTMLDLYSHTVISPELAATAAVALDRHARTPRGVGT